MNWIDINEKLPEITERYDEVMETKVMASDPVLVSIDGESVKYGRFEMEDGRVFFLNAPIIYDTFGEYEYINPIFGVLWVLWLVGVAIYTLKRKK